MTPSVTPPTDRDVSALEEDLSALFFLLKPSRRRQVIWYVTSLNQGEPVSVKELSKHIAVVEEDVAPDAVSNAAYRRVYSNLDQSHLPKLADADVIQYNADRQLVAPGPNRDAFAVLIAIGITVTSLLLAADLS